MKTQMPEQTTAEELKGLDLETTDEELLVITQDQQKLSIPKKIACLSQLLKTLTEGDASATEVPLSVSTPVLKKVREYMVYRASNVAVKIEKPLKSSDMYQVVSKWEADFVNVDQELLFELTLAANYMDIPCLLDLTSAKIASMLKGKVHTYIHQTKQHTYCTGRYLYLSRP